MINIEKLLKQNKSIDAWVLYDERVESYELFFVHKALETVRATDTESLSVTVYKVHDGKIGTASFKIYASTTEKEADEKINAAAKKASLISNEYYELPKDEKLLGEIRSSFADYAPGDIASRMAEAVFSADMLDFGSINALEIFINKHIVTVKNSCGIDKTETKYSSLIEAIPTWNDGESVELYEAIRSSDFDFDKVKEEIEAKMREVRDRGLAEAPASKLTCPVVIPAKELSGLFGEIAGGLDYYSVYTHSNPFSEGDEIQKNCTGDKITLKMCGRINGSVASALFDGAGTTLVDTEIIKDGKVTSYYGTHRFAQYLGKEATGDLRCISALPGTLTEKELASAPYFECVSMSGIQVDVYNDYIGGEVRLAYYFDGEKKIPTTGISISGKLSDALSSLRLSNEVTQSGRYEGPKLAMLYGVEIV